MGAKDHLVAEWGGVLTPPLAWAADLGTSYAVVKWSCNHSALPLYLITFCALAAIGIAALTSFRMLALVPAGVETDQPAFGRVRFMGALGLLTSALFTALVIATAIPQVALRHVCW